jgi:serine/threonine protein kinase
VTTDNILFVITLEYADGGEYFDALQNEVYPYQTLRMHFKRITQAMLFLHHSQWTNLDLSAENILVKARSPLLMDFGMALMTNESANGFRGKEFYAAPELWTNSPCDPVLADLWSLGILLFIMLTRCPPFERANRTCNRFRYVAARPENGLQRMITKFNLTQQFAVYQGERVLFVC